jgi:hypothetical protein
MKKIVITHFEFTSQGHTVSQTHYVDILEGLCEILPNAWIHHHENAPAHKELSVWLKNRVLKLNAHPYSSKVVIALGYGLKDRVSRVRFPAGAGNFSLHHRVQNGSGAHPASYPMGTRGSFPGSKATGT